MLTQNKILKALYENYAVVFPPRDSKEVLQASVTLAKEGIPPIPTDYVTFLTATDGFSWNGTVCYALRPIEREKGLYFHPGIMETYKTDKTNPLMKKKLRLGYAPESLIVYDAVTKEFQLRNRYTFQVITAFPNWVDMLAYLAQSILSDRTAPPAPAPAVSFPNKD